MRKSLVSLGFVASAQVLPAFAHNMTPATAVSIPLGAVPGVHNHSINLPHTATSQIQARIQTSNYWQPPSFGLPKITYPLGNDNQASIQHYVTVGTGSAQSLNLDLSSSATTITAGKALLDQPVSIEVGTAKPKITPDTKLTPAEYLAVLQVSSGLEQSLIVDANGRATGGSIVINQRLSQAIGNLDIPKDVTVIDVTRTGVLKLDSTAYHGIGQAQTAGQFF